MLRQSLGSAAIIAASLLPAEVSGQGLGLPSPVEGVWTTDTGTELTIQPCQPNFCGFISKIVVPPEILAQYGNDIAKIPTDQFTDANNKDPAMRSRPIQGMQILLLKPTSNFYFYDGQIYNPQDGNVYGGSVEVKGPETMLLKGCALYVICQEQLWTRAPAPPADATALR